MEYGFWDGQIVPSISSTLSLNPCCSGIWFLSALTTLMSAFNGVLILVVVEYGFWVLSPSIYVRGKFVLILVVVEYGFWDKYRFINTQNKEMS